MPLVYPQRIKERRSRYSRIGLAPPFQLQQRKKGFYKRHPFKHRIILRDKETHRKLLIAVSRDQEDTLQSEWNYIVHDCLPMVPLNLDKFSQFDWLVAHFAMLYAESNLYPTPSLPYTGGIPAPSTSKQQLPIAPQLTIRDTALEQECLSNASWWSGVYVGVSCCVGLLLLLLMLAMILLPMHSVPPVFIAVLVVALNALAARYYTMQPRQQQQKTVSPQSSPRTSPRNIMPLLQSEDHMMWAVETEETEDAKSESESEMATSYDNEPIGIGGTLVRNEHGYDSLTEKEKMRYDLYGEWKALSAETFQLRVGPDYASNKKKAPSAPALYDIVSVEAYSTDCKVSHVSKYFRFGDQDLATTSIESSHGEMDDFLPPTLVLNVMCPLYAPGLMSTAVDGPGFSVVVICKPSKATQEKLDHGEHSPAMKLLHRYLADHDSDAMQSRFKCIGRVANLEECKLGTLVGGLVRSYNGKPFLVHQNESSVHFGKQYCEIDIDIHSFGSLSRNGFYHLRKRLRSIRADFAFVIEAREDKEMPEQMVACFQCFNVNNLEAKDLPIEL